MSNYGLPEFSRFGCDPGLFRRVRRDEYHGVCPRCGGKDRFVIFTDRPFPHWTWFCRQCHPDSAWIDEINPMLKEPMSIEKALELAEKREASLKAEIERAQTALAELQQSKKWLTYHQQLNDEARQRWESWGIPEFYQGYWKLGYDPDHVVWIGETEWHTPTMTIPIYEPMTWNVLNIRHRLLKPYAPGDKYRPERRGLGYQLFVAEPDAPIYDRTLLVEGEKKAMVSFITADDPTLQVVGIAGKNIPDDKLNALKDCDPLYICLDPDATREAKALAHRLGRDRTRIIELPDKIDDMILAHGLGKNWMRSLMRQAVRI